MKGRGCYLAVLFAAGLAGSVQARPANDHDRYDTCFKAAGARYGIEARLLKAIALTESELRPQAIGRSPRSYDYGLMQINSQHLPRLKKVGIDAATLLRKPCLNIEIGARILADFIRQYGYSWVAIGAYNAGRYTKRRAHLHIRYAHRVFRNYKKTEIRE